MDAMMLQASSGHPDLAGPAAAAIELSAPFDAMPVHERAMVIAVEIVDEIFRGNIEAARFVWRRAGDEVQASRDTLAAWSLARALFIKDTAGFFRMAAKIDASAAVRGMVKAAVGAVRARLMRDVGEAFSTIALDALATRTGLDAGSATKAAVAAGWEVDGKVVRIPPSAAAAGADAEAAMSLRSLHTLTSYVASLERPALVGDAESDVAAFVAAAAAGGGRRGGAGSGSAGASAQMA